MTKLRVLFCCLMMTLVVLLPGTPAGAVSPERTTKSQSSDCGAASRDVKEETGRRRSCHKTQCERPGTHLSDRGRPGGRPASVPGQMILNPFVEQAPAPSSSPLFPKKAVPKKTDEKTLQPKTERQRLEPRTIINPYCVKEDKLAVNGAAGNSAAQRDVGRHRVVRTHL